MKIIIKNPSSPGAMFSNNTNETLVAAFDWIMENNFPIISFKELRVFLATQKGINDNNARNIYPLARNCKFASYSKNVPIDTKNFFTDRGKAYINLLKARDLVLNDSVYTKTQKEATIKNIDAMAANIVYLGLKDLLKKDSNYKEAFQDTIKYLIKYGKINKEEYAIMLYGKQNFSESFLSDISSIIKNYRNNSLELQVQVEVRNDIIIRNNSGNTTRKEGISFLTSYTYFVALLNEADLINKIQDDYYFVNSSNVGKLKMLVED